MIDVLLFKLTLGPVGYVSVSFNETKQFRSEPNVLISISK